MISLGEKILKGFSVVCAAVVLLSAPVSSMRNIRDVDFVFYGNSSKYPAQANVGYNPK